MMERSTGSRAAHIVSVQERKDLQGRCFQDLLVDGEV